MRCRLTKHAIDRIQDRGIVSEAEVLEACNKKTPAASRFSEIFVIVKRLDTRVYFPEGSGDVILACIDTSNGNIKTVEPQRMSQLAKKDRGNLYR